VRGTQAAQHAIRPRMSQLCPAALKASASQLSLIASAEAHIYPGSLSAPATNISTRISPQFWFIMFGQRTGQR
jgi:hypothetical protein